MANLADVIEEFILDRLEQERDDVVVLRRNELADELACAPSQISYVLTTRFTINRGFMVESRRGSGGFVRIARIPIEAIVYEDAAYQVSMNTNKEAWRTIIGRLQGNSLITSREAALLIEFFKIAEHRFDAQECGSLLRSLLLTLAKS